MAFAGGPGEIAALLARPASSSTNAPAGERLDLYGQPSLGRRLRRAAGWGLCALAIGLIATPLVSVLWGVADRAVPAWRFSVIWQGASPTGGGLASEIVGTLLIVAGVLAVAGTVGVCSGVYLAEYATGRVGTVLRTGSEVLAGIPSIVLGYVGYFALVVGLHWGFSLAAALLTLSALTVPYITKTTESALRQVPTAYREGAEALGMRPLHAMRRVTLKAALPGITTGLLVAVAISVGETAPLLYTAGFADKMPGVALTHNQVPYLTYAVWTFFNDPSTVFQDLSFDAALVLVALVLVLIVVSRVVVAATQRHTEKN
jgi:phosphate transport system permease protein